MPNKQEFKNKVIFSTLTVCLIVALAWVVYSLFGRLIIESLYQNRQQSFLNKVISFLGDSTKPLERYLAKAKRVLIEASLISLFMSLLSLGLVKLKRNLRFIFRLTALTILAFGLANFFSLFYWLTPLGSYLIGFWLFFFALTAFFCASRKRKLVSDLAKGLAILLISLGLIEIFSGSFIPEHPKRLRESSRWKSKSLNSIGFQDKERSYENPNNYTRILFIGDSFLEIWEDSIVFKVEDILKLKTRADLECINLGESATDPVDYYWRLRNLGLNFGPDLIALFIYEGNDFSYKRPVSQGLRTNKLIALYPQQSLFSKVFPRSTALLTAINYYLDTKTRSSRHQPSIAPKDWSGLSDSQKEAKLIKFLAKMAKISDATAGQYFKNLSTETKEFIFAEKYLPGYCFNYLLKTVFHKKKFENQVRAADTVKTILAMKKFLNQKGYQGKIKVFFIPVAEKVDRFYLKAFQDLGKTTQLPFGPILTKKEYTVFYEALAAQGIEVFDLTRALKGISKTYDLNGHWNDKGQSIVAKFVAQELEPEIKTIK